MPEWLRYLLPVISGLLGGWISATLASRAKLRELEENFRLDEQRKSAEEKAKNQLRYLNPLRIASIDLLERLEDIDRRVQTHDTFLRDTVSEVNSRAKGDAESFAEWANGFGQYSLATMHIVCVYLARASSIRAELPFVQLSHSGDRELLDHLTAVRVALGGELGLWESLQDSLGGYIRTPDGALMAYREFCLQFQDPEKVHWFHRLIEFLCDLDKKTAGERRACIDSLGRLITFLGEQPILTARAGRSS